MSSCEFNYHCMHSVGVVNADPCIRAQVCWGIKHATCWVQVCLSVGMLQHNRKHVEPWSIFCLSSQLKTKAPRQRNAPPEQCQTVTAKAHKLHCWIHTSTSVRQCQHKPQTPINKGYYTCITTTKSKATVGQKIK